jgi:O-antigen/teichoic acid export membrane protein
MPSDFGLIAMALVFISFSRIVQDFGIGAAVIQKKGIDSDYLNTALISQIIMSLVLSIILIAGRGYIADFYNREVISPILAVLALGLFLRALFVVQRALLVKASNFKAIAILSIVSISIAGLTALLMALYSCGYWSLVALHMVETVCLLLGFWYFSSWRPAFTFSIEKFKEIFNYSAPLFGTQTLTYWTGNIGQLLIGRIHGDTSLGLYSRGNNFVTSPVKSVARAISTPFFPLMSKADSKNQVLTLYNRGMQYILLLFCPLMVTTGFFSYEIVGLLLGEKWLESGFYLQLFSFVGITMALRSHNSNVFKALGNTRSFLKVSVVTKVVSIVVVLLSAQMGLKAIAYSVALTNVLSDLSFVAVIRSMLRGKRKNERQQDLDILKIIVSAVAMLCVLFMLEFIGDTQGSYLLMIVAFSVACTTYAGLLLLLRQHTAMGMFQRLISKY